MKGLKEFIRIFAAYSLFILLHFCFLYLWNCKADPDWGLNIIWNSYIGDPLMNRIFFLMIFPFALIFFIYNVIVGRKGNISRKTYYTGLISSSFISAIFSLTPLFLIEVSILTASHVGVFLYLALASYIMSFVIFITFIFWIVEMILLKIGKIRKRKRFGV